MKKIALIALALIAALTLSACGPATFEEINLTDYVELSNYNGLKFQDREINVSEFAIQSEINAAMNSRGYTTQNYDNTQEGGTVAINDITNIDFKGMIDGVAFEGGSGENYELSIGSNSFIRGFEEQLVGVNVGETVNINVTFPVPYDNNPSLAGVDAVFQVTVNGIIGKTNYPELTDKIAREINENVKTAKELQETIKKELEEYNKQQLEAIKKTQLWNEVCESSTFKKDLPSSLLKRYVDNYRSLYETAAKQNNYASLDAMLEASKFSKKDFEAMIKEDAKITMQERLVAYAIAEAEGYTLSEEDFNESAKKYATAYGYSDPSIYINARGRDMLEDDFVLDYAKALIIEKADITPAK
ncbi:MAG: trigger factor [Clostridia bacterium]|nr:trigger factor [Clostridia bacterium]